MNTNQLRKKNPQLEQLFGAYFYPEWTEEHNTEEEVIARFAKQREIDELLDTLLEIDELKKQFPEDEKLKEIIEDDLGLGNGLCFEYLKMTGEQWLDFVASVIKEDLNKRKNNPS